MPGARKAPTLPAEDQDRNEQRWWFVTAIWLAGAAAAAAFWNAFVAVAVGVMAILALAAAQPARVAKGERSWSLSPSDGEMSTDPMGQEHLHQGSAVHHGPDGHHDAGDSGGSGHGGGGH